MRGLATLPSWSCPLPSASKWGGLAPMSNILFCRFDIYFKIVMLSPVINHFERVADNSPNSTHGNYGIDERDK